MTAHHLATAAPYSDTKVSYGDTKNHIEEMLKEAGAVALRWTEDEDSMKGVGLPTLEFIFKVELNGVEKQIGVRIKPPMTIKTRGTKYNRVHTANRNGSMRLLWWYLKARLEAARFGLEDLSETFLSHTIMALPEGGTATMGEVIRQRPELLRNILPTFEIVQPQLEDRNDGEEISA